MIKLLNKEKAVLQICGSTVASYELELAVGGLTAASKHLIVEDSSSNDKFEDIMKTMANAGEEK